MFKGRRGLRLVYLALVFGVLVTLGYRLRTVLNPLLLALLLAYMTDPLVEVLQRRLRMPRTPAIVVMFLSMSVLIGVLGVYLYGKTAHGLERVIAKTSGGWQRVPPGTPADKPVTSELYPVYAQDVARRVGGRDAYLDLNRDEMWNEGFEPRLHVAPNGRVELSAEAKALGWRRVGGTFDRIRDQLLSRYRSLDRSTVDRVVERLKQNTAALYDGAIAVWSVVVNNLFGGLLTALSYLVLVPVYTFFVLRGFDPLLQFVKGLLPGLHRDRIVHIASDIDRACAAFFRGRFLIALGKAIFTWLGLWAAGVDFAVLIGFLAGALSIIPFLGPVVGFILAVVVSYAPVAWGQKILGALIVFVVVEVLEAIANPLVLGREVGLHPVTILLALFAFGELFGLFGLLLAVPLGAIAKILGREFILPELRALAAERAEEAAAAAAAPPPPG